MDTGLEMLFETTIRSFLGEKAFHIAGHVHSEKRRRTWYRKVLKKVVREAHAVDSSTLHQEAIVSSSERALASLNDRTLNEVRLTLYLLRLVGALLGFVQIKPYRIATLAYFQTPSQEFTEQILRGDGAVDDHHESALSIRRRIVGQLKDEGRTYFEISLVLNCSEYHVKKLWKEC